MHTEFREALEAIKKYRKTINVLSKINLDTEVQSHCCLGGLTSYLVGQPDCSTIEPSKAAPNVLTYCEGDMRSSTHLLPGVYNYLKIPKEIGTEQEETLHVLLTNDELSNYGNPSFEVIRIGNKDFCRVDVVYFNDSIYREDTTLERVVDLLLKSLDRVEGIEV